MLPRRRRSFSHSTASGRPTRSSTTGTITGTCRLALSPSSCSRLGAGDRPLRAVDPALPGRGAAVRVVAGSVDRPGRLRRDLAGRGVCARRRRHRLPRRPDRPDREPRAGQPPSRELGLVGGFAGRLLRVARDRRRRLARQARSPPTGAATGVRRAQLKWLLAGAATAIVGGVIVGDHVRLGLCLRRFTRPARSSRARASGSRSGSGSCATASTTSTG